MEDSTNRSEKTAAVPRRFQLKIGGIRLAAIFEALSFLMIITGLNLILGDGTRFFDFSPHPYWIIILLLTVQYGTNEGLVCSVLASVFLLVWNLPEQSMSGDIFDYLITVFYRPFLWLIASVVLGELRVRQMREKTELRKELGEVSTREQSITRAYENLKEVKENLEMRIAGELRGSMTSYETLRLIEGLNPVQILMGMEDMVTAIANPKKFSVYSFGENGFEVITSSGWEEGESFSRRIAHDSPIFQEITGSHRVLCSINKHDAAILGAEGILAGPIIDPQSREILGMLKIEELDFMDLTMTNVEIFKILCEWAGSAFTQARQYQTTRGDCMHNLDTGTLSCNFGRFQEQFLNRVLKARRIKGSLLKITLANARKFSNDDRKKIAELFTGTLKKKLPKHMLISEGRRVNVEFVVLMPGVTPAKTKNNVEAIMSFMLKQTDPLMRKAEFKVISEKLGE